MFVTIKGVQFEGLKCILEDFLNGKFAGRLPLSAAVSFAFSLSAVEGVALVPKSLNVFDLGPCSNFPAVTPNLKTAFKYLLCLTC